MTEGSAIRRIGHVRWLRNLAVAIGNALRAQPGLPPESQAALRQALHQWSNHGNAVVAESVQWALAT